MSLTPARSMDAIGDHSAGLAALADGNLRAHVEHCPGWSVADLVWHVIEVHWFWRTIVDGLLSEPPGESSRPARPPNDELVDVLVGGADRLLETLGEADQSASCWTWYPPRQDVGFVTRHQVQEAAVHHWDAAHAAGQHLVLEQDVSTDSIEEFLTCSLAEGEDAQRLGVSLDGELVLHATDAEMTWVVKQDGPTAPLLWVPGDAEPTVSGTASDLLLWLYGRVDLDPRDPDLVARFRRLSSTD